MKPIIFCSHLDLGVQCNLKVYAKGLCRPHYDQQRNKTYKSKPKKSYNDRPKVECSSCHKLRVHHSNGKCAVCWEREDYKPSLTDAKRKKQNELEMKRYRKTHRVSRKAQRGQYAVYSTENSVVNTVAIEALTGLTADREKDKVSRPAS